MNVRLPKVSILRCLSSHRLNMMCRFIYDGFWAAAFCV
jgi:hypothetical protein